MTSSPQVAVFLCTYNGEQHLNEQLLSLAGQESVSCRVYVSDDGSTDRTRALLANWHCRDAIHSLEVRSGPGRGYAANFLSLLTGVNASTDYYAFMDQDDIWDTDKLSRALDYLQRQPAELPVLYCSRTRFVSEQGVAAGQSPLFPRPPDFANALVQNIAGGNTMVFNGAALSLLQAAGAVDVASHDWWAYLLVTGAGGKVYYDPQPGLSYRQHADNVIGANTGPRQRFMRYLGALGGRNRKWNHRNLAALEENQHLLTPESRRALAQFRLLRDQRLFRRLHALRSGGFYAQTWIGNLGLYMATLLKKM